MPWRRDTHDLAISEYIVLALDLLNLMTVIVVVGVIDAGFDIGAIVGRLPLVPLNYDTGIGHFRHAPGVIEVKVADYDLADVARSNTARGQTRGEFLSFTEIGPE